MSWLYLSGWHYTEGRSQAQAGMRYPYCKVRPSFYSCRPCGMKTLVLNPAVEGTNYRGSDTLHTVIPALKRLSPINAVSQTTSDSENCQNSCRGRWSEVPLLKSNLPYLNLHEPNTKTNTSNQTMNSNCSLLKLEFINSLTNPRTLIYNNPNTLKNSTSTIPYLKLNRILPLTSQNAINNPNDYPPMFTLPTPNQHRTIIGRGLNNTIILWHKQNRTIQHNLNSSYSFMKLKFMNHIPYPRTNNLPSHMSTDANKKRRAATILAQGREKQTRNIEPEDVDIDPILNQSVKRTYKLETICTQQQAIDPINQRIWIGWIQIEDSTKSKAHETIAKIKLEIEHIQYLEIYEGNNYLVLAIPQHEVNTLTTRTFPPSPNYKLVYIPTQEKIWATKANIATTSTQSQITEGLRRIKKEKTPIGWSMILTKRDSSMLVVYHASRLAWINTEKSLIIEIGNTAHQLNPDVSNIPLPHIHLYTKNKNASYSRNE